MANKYWAAGVSGNWNSTASWSDSATCTPAGAVVPGSGDAAIFNAASGTVTATLDISPTIQTLTCTGFTGTLAFGTNTITLNSTGTIFTGATTMAVTGTPLIICTDSSSSSRTISPTAVTEANSISFRITGGTGNLGLTAGSYRDLDFTDGTNPTGYGGLITNTAITIYGNYKASTSGMSLVGGNGTLTFAATSGTKTITTAAVVFDRSFTFNGVGGTWQLQDALTSGATRTTTLTNGTLNLNGYTLSTGSFSSNNSNVRTLTSGGATITLTGSGTTIWNTGTSTNLTYTTIPTANANYSLSVGTRTINTSATSQFNLNVTAGTDTVTNIAGSSFNNLNFTGFAGTFSNVGRYIFGNLTLSTGMTLTSGALVTQFVSTSTATITSNGKTIDFPITFDGIGGTFACQDALTLGSTRALTMTNGTLQLKSGTTSTVGSFVTSGTTQKFLQATTNGSQATLSQASGTVSASYLTIQDSAATGGATFNAFTSNANVNAGNNTGWKFGSANSAGGFLQFF